MPGRILTTHGVATVLLLCALGSRTHGDGRAAGTRAEGLRLGPYAVGFESIRGIDDRRRISRGSGTLVGMAVWYPARPSASGPTAMSAMDYRLLDRSTPPTPAARQSFESEEVDALVGWRHVGIVPLTSEQAKASLVTRGIAIQKAIARPGRFPVVVILGGPYYLSTTAEVLASHGLLVVAPFRVRDQANELDVDDFRGYIENSLGDGEWALEHLRSDRRADMHAITTIGHGGGGMQAMLLAMRNRSVTAVVNVDAGNFSSRSQPEQIVFYSPRLLRVPYLYIATADTRNGQDRFDDFVAMKFSHRIEVVLGAKELRHHDLSDIGRGVTVPLRIRGDAQRTVETNYADVQEMVARFVVEHSTNGATKPSLSEWLEAHDLLTVTLRPGIEPALSKAAVLQSLSGRTVADLKDARRRDPEATLFEEHALSQIVAIASARQTGAAEGLAEFAIGVHPTSAVLLAQASEIALDAGDRAKAVERARSCAALKVDSDWQAAIAVAKCTALLQRMQPADAARN